MFTQGFSLSHFPKIEFGSGKIQCLPNKIKSFGQRVLLITGQYSFYQSIQWTQLINELERLNIQWFHQPINQEPSPDYVDSVVQEFHSKNIQCVVAIGGGSALDSAKAISGLLKTGDSVMNYLEGVGHGKTYQGPSIPFIAVPTTAGTGSEATKNAVLSSIGDSGYKKSFRDDQLIAQYAIIDPDLLASCPKSLIAANGMDALTQLMESYLSTKANPFTDALALNGIECVRDSLLVWYQSKASDNSLAIQNARAKMAYAAFLSGITLAQVGLGSVHGLASPLGAFFPIPHGMACGKLLYAATEINIQAMQQRDTDNPGLQRYAHLGRIMSQNNTLSTEDAHNALLNILDLWTKKMSLKPLSDYGVSDIDIDRLVANISPSSMQTNPIELTLEEKQRLVNAGL